MRSREGVQVDLFERKALRDSWGKRSAEKAAHDQAVADKWRAKREQQKIERDMRMKIALIERQQERESKALSLVVQIFGPPGRKLFRDAIKNERGGVMPYRAMPWRTV
jgi:hypothetical protein